MGVRAPEARGGLTCGDMGKCPLFTGCREYIPRSRASSAKFLDPRPREAIPSEPGHTPRPRRAQSNPAILSPWFHVILPKRSRGRWNLFSRRSFQLTGLGYGSVRGGDIRPGTDRRGPEWALFFATHLRELASAALIWNRFDPAIGFADI